MRMASKQSPIIAEVCHPQIPVKYIPNVSSLPKFPALCNAVMNIPDKAITGNEFTKIEFKIDRSASIC